MAEKYCLKWNDFLQNITSSLEGLRVNREFSDVTLVCEDGQQVKAHQIILSASSPFFQALLGQTNHPQPLIFMRGIKVRDLEALLDFIYFGETNICHENLDSFLAVAGELQLKGLTREHNSTPEVNQVQDNPEIKTEVENGPPVAAEIDMNGEVVGAMTTELSTEVYEKNFNVLHCKGGINFEAVIRDLDDKVKSFMVIQAAKGSHINAQCVAKKDTMETLRST